MAQQVEGSAEYSVVGKPDGGKGPRDVVLPRRWMHGNANIGSSRDERGEPPVFIARTLPQFRIAVYPSSCHCSHRMARCVVSADVAREVTLLCHSPQQSQHLYPALMSFHRHRSRSLHECGHVCGQQERVCHSPTPTTAKVPGRPETKQWRRIHTSRIANATDRQTMPIYPEIGRSQLPFRQAQGRVSRHAMWQSFTSLLFPHVHLAVS